MNYFVLIKLLSFRGESGIRTRGTLLEYTHFPGVLLKPLGHLSKCLPTPQTLSEIVAKSTQFFIWQTKIFDFLLQQFPNCLNHSIKASSRPGWNFALFRGF